MHPLQPVCWHTKLYVREDKIGRNVNIKAARRLTKGKVFVIFQPHTFSRTRDLWEDFKTCFAGADEVCIFKIYPAREKSIEGISQTSLADAIDSTNLKACSASTHEELMKWISQKISPDDVVLVLGAGDIEKFCEYIKTKII